MQVDHMDQGSLIWHEHRAKYRNASEASIIMDCAPAYWKTSKRILWEQKQGLRGSNVDENNPAIMHGNNMEAAALACLNKQLGSNMKPAVFVEGKYSASLDGYGADAEGRLIKCEIKCPWKAETSQVWKMAADGEIAEYYRWQMIHQDHCAPTEQSFFFVYISDEKNILIPHLSPEEDTAALLAAWDEFASGEPAQDWEDRTDDDIRVLVERHRDLVQRSARRFRQSKRRVLLTIRQSHNWKASTSKPTANQGHHIKKSPTQRKHNVFNYSNRKCRPRRNSVSARWNPGHQLLGSQQQEGQGRGKDELGQLCRIRRSS